MLICYRMGQGATWFVFRGIPANLGLLGVAQRSVFSIGPVAADHGCFCTQTRDGTLPTRGTAAFVIFMGPGPSLA